ncbi:MAG: T9SS type A sorting domain-containing protein, partial [Candidatus Eisenbacteria bacterium]
GGTFTSIGGQSRNRIAQLDAATGLATSWNPGANGEVGALEVSSGTVYAGGSFTVLGGLARNHLGAISVAAGTPTAWNPWASGSSGGISSIAVGSSAVYVGGFFTDMGGQPRSHLAALDPVTGAATSWRADADQSVTAVAVSGGGVFAGGYFTLLGAVPRQRLAAIDDATGEPTAWAPDADGQVQSLLASGATLFVGGAFDHIAGQPRRALAALDLASGAATGWHPGLDPLAVVRSMVLHGSDLYVGGSFTAIGLNTTPSIRLQLAAVNAVTGVPTAFDPAPNGAVHVLEAGGTEIFVAGSFTIIGGNPRSGVAALNWSNGQATPFQAGLSAPGTVRALAYTGTSIILGGNFTSVQSVPRAGLAELTLGGGVTPWNPAPAPVGTALPLVTALRYLSQRTTSNGGESFHSVLYVAGLFSAVGGQSRKNLAALRLATTSQVLDWNPGCEALPARIDTAGSSILLSGGFTGAANRARANLARIAQQPVISSLYPAQGGTGGTLLTWPRGLAWPPGTDLRLRRIGDADIVATLAPEPRSETGYSATFDLTSAPTGPRSAIVTTPDGQSYTLQGAFQVEGLVAPQLELRTFVPTEVRTGIRTAIGFMVINRGNVNAPDVPLWLLGLPADLQVLPLSALHATAPQALSGEPAWSQVPLVREGGASRYVSIDFPRMYNGFTTPCYLAVTPGASLNGDYEIVGAITRPWVSQPNAIQGCASAAGIALSMPCLANNMISTGLAPPTGNSYNGTAYWAQEAWRCEGQSSLASATGYAQQVLDVLAAAVSAEPPAVACSPGLAPIHTVHSPIYFGGALDPNDLIGPVGQVALGQPLPYQIRFENLATATADAQVVHVQNALDSTRFDLASLSLGDLTIGTHLLSPPPGAQQYSATLDLRPGKPVIVRVEASLDRPTAVLDWRFQALDPATLTPLPASSLLGFLPPNTAPPEGEGSVSYVVMPRAGLADGTLLTNQASITFDANPAILTPVWSNVLDGGVPTSRVSALAPAQDSASFTVHWQAGAGIADVRDYTVYVSRDGQPFQAWLTSTRATAAAFPAEQGHFYEFFSTARDSAGNLESSPIGSTGPDAQTFVTSPSLGLGDGPALSLRLGGVHPNPARAGMHVEFTLPGIGAASLEVLDVGGRRVLLHNVGSAGRGTHTVTLDPEQRLGPGIYWLRLRRGSEVRTAKAVVMR